MGRIEMMVKGVALVLLAAVAGCLWMALILHEVAADAHEDGEDCA